MRFKSLFCLYLVTMLAPLPAGADVKTDGAASQTPPIALPADGDDYSRLVAQAAAHDPATDFHALRFAWLDSAARGRRNERGLGEETRKLFAAMRASDDTQVRGSAVALLSLQFTDLNGQAALQQACLNLHDQACAEEAKFVMLGLARSILATGDGKTCPTGWEVATVPEEYAVLRMMGLQPRRQALIMGQGGSHSCDEMTVATPDGKEQTLYFTIDRVMADEMKMFQKK